jgi:hypothetical protein
MHAGRGRGTQRLSLGVAVSSISSGTKPEAKVLAPASSSMAVFIPIGSSYNDWLHKIHLWGAGAVVSANHEQCVRSKSSDVNPSLCAVTKI